VSASEATATMSNAARARPGERVLFADMLPPAPDRAAMSVRSAQFLSFLVRNGYRVDFMAANEWVGPPVPNVLADLGVSDTGIRDYDAAAAFAEMNAADYHVAILAWSQVAHRLMSIVRRVSPRTFIVFDTHDVNHIREFRQAKVTGNQRPLKRAVTLRQWEATSAEEADCTIAITPVDARTLRSVAPGATIRVATIAAAPQAPAIRRSGASMIFVGNFTSPPNYDAALVLAHEVLPRVRAELPAATLTLVGDDPAGVVAAAVAAPGVVFTGWVPDLAPPLAAATVFVGGLRFGSGVKGKMLQAMAAGLPCVATSIAAEGIALADGHDCLLADTPEAMAAAALRIIRDPDLGQMLARNAAEVIVRDYAPARIDAQYAEILALRSART
jgi:glycosyltransferase involved in cell wall biosynthesis